MSGLPLGVDEFPGGRDQAIGNCASIDRKAAFRYGLLDFRNATGIVGLPVVTSRQLGGQQAELNIVAGCRRGFSGRGSTRLLQRRRARWLY